MESANEALTRSDYRKIWDDWNKTSQDDLAGKLSASEMKDIADMLFDTLETMLEKDTLREKIEFYEMLVRDSSIRYTASAKDAKAFEKTHGLSKKDVNDKDMEEIADLAAVLDRYAGAQRTIKKMPEAILKSEAEIKRLQDEGDASGAKEMMKVKKFQEDSLADARSELKELEESADLEQVANDLEELEREGAEKIADKMLDDGGLLDEIGYFMISEKLGLGTEGTDEDSADVPSVADAVTEDEEFSEFSEERGSSREIGDDDDDDDADVVVSRAAIIQDFLTILKEEDRDAYNAVSAAIKKSARLIAQVTQRGGRRRRRRSSRKRSHSRRRRSTRKRSHSRRRRSHSKRRHSRRRRSTRKRSHSKRRRSRSRSTSRRRRR